MSRDYSRIAKEINDSNKELYSKEFDLEKDVSSIKKEIAFLRNSIQEINTKVDELIDVMSNLTIMFIDEEESDEDDEPDLYDTDNTWVPNEEDDWYDSNDKY